MLLQVRVWNAERGKTVDTLNVSRAVYCLAAAEQRGGLIVFGGAEPTVRLWDSRAKADPSGVGFGRLPAPFVRVSPCVDLHCAYASFVGFIGCLCATRLLCCFAS